MPVFKLKTEAMPKEERKALKDFLKAKGMKQKDLDAIPDEGTDSRESVSTKLTAMCQKFPKAV